MLPLLLILILTVSASAHVRDPTPKELAAALIEKDAHRLARSYEGPERSWQEMWGNLPVCDANATDTWRLRGQCVPRGYTGEELLTQPKWVPSDQPTDHREGRWWMKLQL